MAKVKAKMKIMPTSPDTDLEKLQEDTEREVKEFGGEIQDVEIEPIAFGLKAVMVTFAMDEEQGSPDPLEEKLSELEAVNSAEVIEVSRAVG